MFYRNLLLVISLLISLNASAKEWLIDVRTPDEYRAEHAAESLNIEYQDIVSGINKLNVDKDDDIYLYCRSGRRAEVARETLAEHGFRNVVNLGTLSGVEAWLQTKK